jgi:hypothetical protein
MTYENGFLRSIRDGEEELLRMIYFAIRNKDWDTIPSVITREHIVKKEDGFTITYQRDFEDEEIHMQWQVQIEGLAGSGIHFEIKGEALRSFQKNRAGFCILHPIKEYAGKDVLVTHADNSVEKRAFPSYISPHQPFLDILSMEWLTAAGDTGRLHFKGDVFETEDQRNWTDDSFKTYCTPLELPFPSFIRQGDIVHQKVHFTLSPSPMPAIGIGRSAVRSKNYMTGLEKLSSIGFDHYRTGIRLSDKSWAATLTDAVQESRLLKAPLELVLFPGENEDELYKFLGYGLTLSDMKSIILLPLGASALPLLRERFPGIPIGSGTDSHFAELNRSVVSTEGLDFVSYAIHPQVHAFDDVSLMENAQAQGYTVQTALHKYGIPVHISSVSLHARHVTDTRLHTSFGARWTLASLKSLKSAGAASITYFEALGEKGIASMEEEFIPFPVMEVLKEHRGSPSIMASF